jgi:leader peptidase (prepilin peptidase)/N-methyltransferase
MIPLIIIFAALFGLILGSFLNVCIYRLPRDESIIRPRSQCPGCKETIRWYDNIPLFSYLLLLGKCRHCDRRISIQYPLVEMLTAALSVVIVLWFPSPEHYIGYFLLLVAPLIVITFIDLEHFIVPDVISLPGIIIGVVVHLYLGAGPVKGLIIDSILGILVGGGSLFLLGWTYEKIRGRIGLGMGDAKLAAMLGAFFGWRAIIFILLMSSLLGTVVGLIYIMISRRGLKQPIPYGPFLAFAAGLYLFFGPQIIDWYLSLTRQLYK